MEQVREQDQEQEQPPPPLRCPRCNSLDTKFRYYNNHDKTQPRHHCRTCKRQWTVGGSLRNIPIGGKPRNNKQPKASSSISTYPQSQLPQPPLLLGEERLQYLQSLTPWVSMVPQNLPTMVSPSSSYYFNDEISCWDAIQSLIQSDGGVNQHLNGGYQFGSGGANMAVPIDWNIQPMASHHDLTQQIPGFVESYQTHNQVNNATPSLYDNSLVQPTWPMNSLPQDVMNNFGASTSNSSPWNNFTGTITDADMNSDTNSVNVDEWLNLPGYDSS